ncbi:MAG: hypothetical protein Q9P44_01760 [Anaerolineae bacterium]|nr:hypothetical protein [Anaerolineae bacterium]
MSRKLLSLLLLILVTSALAVTVSAQDEEEQTVFHLRGTVVQSIGEYPDNFSYDGSNVIALDRPGFFEVHVDTETNTGIMFARFYVNEYQMDADTLLEDAQVTVIFPLFGAPTGVMPEYWEGGIATDVDLHGNSGHEAPVLPTVFNALASWGPALVFVDGEQVMGGEEIMGVPNVTGAFAGHVMYTNEVRDADTGVVYNEAMDAPYSPMAPADGIATDDDVSLLHLIVRSEVRDDEAFPPFSMFMHFNFLDVQELGMDEINPMLMEMEPMTFEGMNAMMESMEMDEVRAALGEQMGQVMGLINMTEEALFGEESD